MPYQSDAQRRFMHAQHPQIAKRWDREYGGAAQGSRSRTMGKIEGQVRRLGKLRPGATGGQTGRAAAAASLLKKRNNA